MFGHLDDPNPPEPTQLVIERIAAEGARRVRHRRMAAGSVAALVLTLGITGVAVSLPSDDSSDDVEIRDDRTTLPTVPPSTTVTTTPGTTTSTTTDDAGQTGPTTPGPDEGGDVFAAIVQASGRDVAQVVLANATTGTVDRVLAEFPLLNRPASCCLASSQDSRTVYYVVPAGDYGSGMVSDTIWRVATNGGDPEQVVAGTNPSLSPDDTRLAYTTPLGGDAPPALVVRELDDGGERRFVLRSVDNIVYATGFADDDTVVFARGGLEEGSRVAAISLLGGVDELAGAEVLGPPSSAPPGTTWSSPDHRVTDGRLGVVENCCELDANSTDGDRSYLVVDPAGGAVLDRVALPGYMLDAEAGPAGTELLFLRPPADSPGPNTLLRWTGTELVEVGAGIDFIAIDWT